jgi:hypothetical protein
MQYGKFVVKTKRQKVHRKEFDKQQQERDREKIKHSDKAFYTETRNRKNRKTLVVFISTKDINHYGT